MQPRQQHSAPAFWPGVLGPQLIAGRVVGSTRHSTSAITSRPGIVTRFGLTLVRSRLPVIDLHSPSPVHIAPAAATPLRPPHRLICSSIWCCPPARACGCGHAPPRQPLFVIMSDNYEDGAAEQMDEEEQPQQQQRLRSTVHVAGKKKGRGFREEGRGEEGEEAAGNARYESLEPAGGSGPAKSVEGWVLFVTGLHEEAQEEDVAEAFADYGDVKNVYLNLDRQTGYVKGYALIEYATEKEAREAIKGLDGTELLGQAIHINWAFVRGGPKGSRRR